MAGRCFQALCLLLLTTLLAGCQSSTPDPGPGPSAAGVIEIGADLALSGSQAAVGQAAENGMRLAIARANRQHVLGGYTLALAVRDDVGASGLPDPSIGAVNVLELLGRTPLAGIIGPLASEVARAQLPLTNQRGIAQISPASSATCLTRETPQSGCIGAFDLVPLLRPTGRLTYFRLAPPADLQGVLSADFVYHTLNARRVVVLTSGQDADDLALSFRNQFTADGGRIVEHLPGERATARGIALAAPDLIYFADHAPGAEATLLALRTQLAAMGRAGTIPWLIGDTLAAATLASVPASGLVGRAPVYLLVAPAPADAGTTPEALDFIRAYQASYGPPGMYSAGSYDCTWILIHAIAAALSTGARPPAGPDDSDAASNFRQAVLAAINKTDEQGVTGRLHFDPDGDSVNRTIAIYRLSPASVDGWTYVGARAAP
ncbi:MAG TPA: branched-chain amino acid ABC transporter substrate-binding protein [Ktedonobacteraceae bacterium]|jgi:branched-chain amino acid transport system substrate-binding protein